MADRVPGVPAASARPCLRGESVAIMGDAREARDLAAALAAAGARPERVRPAALAGLSPPPIAAVCAAHPFDVETAEAARAAARALGLPYARLVRRRWTPGPGDRWRRVRSPAAAARALDPSWRRIFIALGRDRLRAFERMPGRLLYVRAPGRANGNGAPDAPPPRLARARLLREPGPYDEAGEAILLRRLGVDALVVRNAGGADAWPKLGAARRLGLPVVLVEPPPPGPRSLDGVGAALAWLTALAQAGGAP